MKKINPELYVIFHKILMKHAEEKSEIEFGQISKKIKNQTKLNILNINILYQNVFG